MEFIPLIATVSLVHLLAVISPGPDFILATRNSLTYSRKVGIYTSVGLGLGILVHVTYSLIGVGLLISKSVLLFSAIKILGALYIIYIGYKSLISKHAKTIENNLHNKQDLSKLSAIKMGFITNVTNPKATLFLSLFTVLIGPDTPIYVKLFLGVEMSVVTFLWFSLVSILLTHSLIKSKISKVQHTAEKIMGAMLIVLGVKLALSSTK